MECPKCNYPNIDGIDNCQDCGYDLSKVPLLNKSHSIQSEEENANQDEDILKESEFEDSIDGQLSRKTIKNTESSQLRRTVSDKEYLHPMVDGEYNLQPVSLGEKTTIQPLYFDDQIEVNRGMIDEDDFSISSGSHAIITKIKGRWYLENSASNSAVFIKVKPGKKVRLELGDIVLIGAKKFFEFQKTEDKER